MKKDYLLVGQFQGGFRGPLGISVFPYDPERGSLSEEKSFARELAAGFLCVDAAKSMVYAVDERNHPAGRLGGGSDVHTFRMDPAQGTLSAAGRIGTLSPTPSALALTEDGRFLLVCHNGGEAHVTKLFRDRDGTFRSAAVFEDAALVLLALGGDGTPEKIADVVVFGNDGEFGPRAEITEGSGEGGGIFLNPGTAAHLHCVTVSPDGAMAVVCDIGLGKLYTLGLDSEKGRLVRKQTYLEALGWGVRYGAFHPSAPFFYVNCERAPKLIAYRYDAGQGTLEKIGESDTLPAQGDPAAGSTDLQISADGSMLYCACLSNQIAAFRIGSDGALAQVQTVDCCGERPRALALSPDGRFLFCGCTRSATLTRFRIGSDGKLSGGTLVAQNLRPSCIRFFGPSA